jgi:acetoin utilization deacetylase AcuC-like enzyme
VSVAILTHPSFARHETGPGHPERPARVQAALDALRAAPFADALTEIEAPAATRAQLERVHAPAYVEHVHRQAPRSGLVLLDPDTAMGPHSLEAALHAAGAAVRATDLVIEGAHPAAFVAARPPGHHAERGRAMGFCLFDNVAVAAAHALAAGGLERVAIVDFDVHHGNGTEDIFRDEPRVLFCSSFQHPFYPFSGAGTSGEHVRNLPLPAGTAGRAYRDAVRADWIPALHAFRPEMVFFSAGFDGHAEDTMASFGLVEADYAWVTRAVMAVAEEHAGGRVVSVLEGGYALAALGRSVVAHVGALLRAPGAASPA